MADEVPLRECVRCREARNALGGLVVVISRRYEHPIYRVHCSKCGSDSPERLSREEAVEAHNTRVPDPALAAKDARIAELEAELVALKARTCETCNLRGEDHCLRGGCLLETACPEWELLKEES